jgi:hypothetical protein
MARTFGSEYIWIDSLCIIRDSSEDLQQRPSTWHPFTQTQFLPYQLLYPTLLAPNFSIPIPWTTHSRRAQSEAQFSTIFFLTNHSVSSFYDGVEKGTLSDHGWCLQERQLSRRTLHFGATQAHWECLSGVWSAGSDKNIRKNPHGTMNSQLLGASSLPLAKLKDIPTIFVKLRQGYAHQPHGTW